MTFVCPRISISTKWMYDKLRWLFKPSESSELLFSTGPDGLPIYEGEAEIFRPAKRNSAWEVARPRGHGMERNETN